EARARHELGLGCPYELVGLVELRAPDEGGDVTGLRLYRDERALDGRLREVRLDLPGTGVGHRLEARKAEEDGRGVYRRVDPPLVVVEGLALDLRARDEEVLEVEAEAEHLDDGDVGALGASEALHALRLIGPVDL